MTAQDIVDSVHTMRDAAEQAISWMSPGGCCCNAPREHGYCTKPSCGEWHDYCSAKWAREAAHEAGNLIELAIEISEARA